MKTIIKTAYYLDTMSRAFRHLQKYLGPDLFSIWSVGSVAIPLEDLDPSVRKEIGRMCGRAKDGSYVVKYISFGQCREASDPETMEMQPGVILGTTRAYPLHESGRKRRLVYRAILSAISHTSCEAKRP